MNNKKYIYAIIFTDEYDEKHYLDKIDIIAPDGDTAKGIISEKLYDIMMGKFPQEKKFSWALEDESFDEYDVILKKQIFYSSPGEIDYEGAFTADLIKVDDLSTITKDDKEVAARVYEIKELKKKYNVLLEKKLGRPSKEDVIDYETLSSMVEDLDAAQEAINKFLSKENSNIIETYNELNKQLNTKRSSIEKFSRERENLEGKLVLTKNFIVKIIKTKKYKSHKAGLKEVIERVDKKTKKLLKDIENSIKAEKELDVAIQAEITENKLDELDFFGWLKRMWKAFLNKVDSINNQMNSLGAELAAFLDKYDV